MKSLRRTTAATLGLCLLALSPTQAATAQRSAAPPDGGDFVNDWNAIAVRTMFVDNLTPIPSGQVYFGFVSSAVYDAVRAARRTHAGVDGRVGGQASGQAGVASVRAAVATAAHDVLAEYFPSSAVALAADLDESLDQLPDGRREDRGIAIGAAAAASLIADRLGDGRDARITLDVTPAPGVWRPTSPGTSMLVPWLGFVEPMLLDSATQIRLGGPDSLTSRKYTADFAEEKAVGSLDSTVRTAAQTETALFWNVNSVQQFQNAMRDLSVREDMGARKAARMFAAVNMTTSDSIITCWRAKYDHAFWRPVTAITEAATDGNPMTTADPDWAPLVATPPYPDYPSGHACVTGAVATGLAQLAGSDHIDLDVDSVVNGVPMTRHFTSARMMIREAFNARIWLGIHFRTAMTDASHIGRRASILGFRELGLARDVRSGAAVPARR